MERRPVLIVEPEAGMQRQLIRYVVNRGYAPVVASSVGEALAALAHACFAFSVVDFGPNQADQNDLFGRLPIVLLCHRDGLGRATEVLPQGVAIVQKPFDDQDLDRAIKEVIAVPPLAGGRPPEDDPAATLGEEIALWCSPGMQEVREIIRRAAEVGVTVLITGETGTGKDLVARAIHHSSGRRHGPFVKVNCAAVPRELLESELFGHERGAFTGAHQLRIGKFEAAQQGTIFLDEVGDLHPAVQAKLLHVLQDGEFWRVGGHSPLKAGVRVLAATNRDLERAVEEGRFRQDLYYRLNVIQINVPPLRARLEEIPGFTEYFVRQYAKLFHREPFRVPPLTTALLMQHFYPGNVRELENIVKRMVVRDDPFLNKVPPPWREADDENPSQRSLGMTSLALKEVAGRAAAAAERKAMARALAETGWNRFQAAKLLKISDRALRYKIKQRCLDNKLDNKKDVGLIRV